MKVGNFLIGFHQCKSTAPSEWEKREKIAAYGDENMGLGNARQFQRDIGRAIAGFRRTGTPCSIAIVDVSLALRPTSDLPNAVAEEVALRLLESARTEDSVCRISGQRFVTILHNATTEGAELFSERVRRLLASDQLAAGNAPSYLRVDTGVAQWSDDLKTVDSLLLAADASLRGFAAELNRQREAFAHG